MIKFFYKKSKITQQDWDKAYKRIVEIVDAYPTKLLRIESYNGFTPELDVEHFDLFVEKGTPNEHISFYGDAMSYTARMTMRIYKNWDVYCEKVLIGNENDETQPVTWSPPEVYKDDGSSPKGNGLQNGPYGIDPEGARYKYAIVAIGTMLENLLLGKFFMVVQEIDADEVSKVVEWLEGHFNEDFQMPIYFDKKTVVSFVHRPL